MKRKAEEMEAEEMKAEAPLHPLKKACTPWQQYLKTFAKEQGKYSYSVLFTFCKYVPYLQLGNRRVLLI